jgi:hypothetical protein
MLSTYPYVPIGGEMGMNCAVMSYNGTLFVGFTGDAKAIPDISQLPGFFAESFAELRDAAGVHIPKSVHTPKKKPRPKVKVAVRKAKAGPAAHAGAASRANAPSNGDAAPKTHMGEAVPQETKGAATVPNAPQDEALPSVSSASAVSV